MKKRGRLLSASYEAIKHQRADVLTVALSQIGSSIAKAQLTDAVELLLNGDGRIPPAESISTTSTSFTYRDMLDFWNSFGEFNLNVILASSETVRELLALPEFSDFNTGNTFLTKGSIITPFGAKIIKTSAVPENMILGLDKSFALEMVTAGGIQVEYDKLIDTQLERAAISCTYGFSKLFPEAIKAMTHA